MITRESLWIFWPADDSGQEEKQGLVFFGWWGTRALPDLDLAKIRVLWTDCEAEFRAVAFDAPEYKTWAVEMTIVNWPNPDRWTELIEASLKWLTGQGASLAWCGDEDASPSPDIFDPGKASGNVYAAYSRGTGFVCNAGLEEEVAWLDDKQLVSVLKGAIPSP